MRIDAPHGLELGLSADRTKVRLQLPPLPVNGQSLNVHVDLDAVAVEGVLNRLMVLRTQMLPPPRRN